MSTVEWVTGSMTELTRGRAWDAMFRVLDVQPARRCVLYLDAAGGTLATTVADAFIATFTTTFPGRELSVIGHAPAAARDAIARIDIDGRRRVYVESPASSAGVGVPDLWLTTFAFVSIVAPRPHATLRTYASCAAHARLLDAGGAGDVESIHAAIHLTAPDVAIACGHPAFGDASSTAWLAWSASAVSLDAAITSACGVSRNALPHLAYIDRHDLPHPVEIRGSAPELIGYVTPRPKHDVVRLFDRGSLRVRKLRKDLEAARTNLRRAPAFICRRWPRLARLMRTSG